MVELGIVGSRGSGKTTVMEGLVKYLSAEGFRVATVKHTSHSHHFDTPGKDSYRHRQAGAQLTVAISNEEIAVFAQSESLSLREFQSMTRRQFDIWLIEGERSSERPKILVTRDMKELSDNLPDNIVATIGPEKLDSIPYHFENGDIIGLGSFVKKVILDEKAEVQE